MTGAACAQGTRAGIQRGPGGVHVVDQDRLAGGGVRTAIVDAGGRQARGLPGAQLAAGAPRRVRQSDTGRPSRRQSERASSSAWLKPRLRRREGCSGTGTSARRATMRAGAPAAICAAIVSASASGPANFSAVTARRALAS